MQKPVCLSGVTFQWRVPYNDNKSKVTLRLILFWVTSMLALVMRKSLLNDQKPDV